MSFVISVCGNSFSLIMSDGRLCKFDINDIKRNVPVEENFEKIIYVNKFVCIGFTGDATVKEIIYNVLDNHDVKDLFLDDIEVIVVSYLKTFTFNKLGVKLIITGVRKNGIFATYKYDSLANYEKFYECKNGEFYICYSGNLISGIDNIVKKHLNNTMPWRTIEDLQSHMADCIMDVAKIDFSVNTNIYGRLILNESRKKQ